MEKEQLKQECINRMKQLDIYKPYIKGFESKQEKVCFFENFGGYWVNQEPEVEAKMKWVEEHLNCKVYAITHEYTDFGECWDFIFVSVYDKVGEELEHYQNDSMFLTYAYVWNRDDESCSEAGTIAIASFGGGIKRVS